MSKYRLTCKSCGYPLKAATRADFEECGALFRHVHRDAQTRCDLDVGHTPEPVVVYPNGDEEAWSSTYVRRG